MSDSVIITSIPTLQAFADAMGRAGEQTPGVLDQVLSSIASIDEQVTYDRTRRQREIDRLTHEAAELERALAAAEEEDRPPIEAALQAVRKELREREEALAGLERVANEWESSVADYRRTGSVLAGKATDAGEYGRRIQQKLRNLDS
jgi:thioredoxin-like negative regulator of GroEL